MTVNIMDHRRIASARDFNDTITAIQNLNRLQGQGIGTHGGDAPVVYCSLSFAFNFAWDSYGCNPAVPGWSIHRGSMMVRGLRRGDLPHAYELASSDRINYPATHSWVTGPERLLLGTPLTEAANCIWDTHFNWGCAVGPKYWQEDNSVMGWKPIGAPDPNDGNTYIEWYPPGQEQCCNESSCLPAFHLPVFGDYQGGKWEGLVAGEGALEQSPTLRYGSAPIDNVVGSWGSHGAIISGVGVPVSLSDFFVRRNDRTGVNQCYLRVKVQNLRRTTITRNPGNPKNPIETISTDGINWLLLGRRTATVGNVQVPQHIWEPVGGALDLQNVNLQSGIWKVINATALLQRMIALKDSIYDRFALMPSVVADYINATDMRSVLQAMVPKLCWRYDGPGWGEDGPPAPDPLPATGDFQQVTFYKTNQVSDWMNGTGDYFGAEVDEFRLTYIAWGGISISPEWTQFNLDDDQDSFEPGGINGNLPRMD